MPKKIEKGLEEFISAVCRSEGRKPCLAPQLGHIVGRIHLAEAHTVAVVERIAVVAVHSFRI